MVTRCPVCQSKKIVTSDKGIRCKNCSYIWKPSNSIKVKGVKNDNNKS